MKTFTAFEAADPRDLALIQAVQDGLPLVPQPYAEVGRRIGLSEPEVRERLRRLLDRGDIRRLGVVVRHRALGYRHNAMVVWDVPDARVSELGRTLGAQAFVTLCYRRPRRPPHWPYNLFCMIHGRDRDEVLANLADMVDRLGLRDIPHRVLFSRRCFKQCGARYAPPVRPLDAEVSHGLRTD